MSEAGGSDNAATLEALVGGEEGSQSLTSRVAALERAVLDKDRALDELNETSGAFKLLNEKQVAELNAKDLLLARKNERIEELLQQLKERETHVQSRERVILQLQLKTQELEGEIQDLKDQLEKEEEEFAMISAAMDTKEQLLAKKNDEIVTLKDVEKQLHKDIDRLQVQMRKLEKHVVELQPETMDACLSPRSFSENQLIQLRDDAINAKTKEIWILAGKNDQLRIQLDELESELERLQTSYVSKENDLARRDRKIEKLEAEIEGLQVSRQQAEGRERAVEIATTQNAKLLQALQALEAEACDLKVQLKQTESECIQLRQAHRENLEKSAVNEVEVLHKSKEVAQKSSMLGALQEKLARERKSLHEELAQERMKAQLEVEKLQSELVMRRNKQYELTLRLQEVEAKFHHTNDELERVTEQFIVTRLRMEEAERVLSDALVWKRALEDELTTCRADGEQRKKDMEKQLGTSQSEAATLRRQLNELKESLLKSLDDAKKKDFRVQDLRRSIDGKDQLLTEQKDRIARLVHEVTKSGQARAELELEKKVLGEQLDRIKQQMADSLRACMEQQRMVEEKCQKETAKYKDVEKELTNEQRGKSKLLRHFVQAYGASATLASASSGSIKSPMSSCLDLRECWLADSDLAQICTLLETNNALRKILTRVDLRSNRITQEGVRAIVRYLRQSLQPPHPSSASCVREFDLRGNFVSIEGIRLVANALEGMASPDQTRDTPFVKVMVISGGRIECYPNLLVSNNEIPVLTVDITENADPDTLLTIAQPTSDYRHPNRRRREDGAQAGPPAVTRTSSSFDPVLQEIYGLDLVNAFMGDSIKSSLGPPSSRVRRKSSERTRLSANNESDGAGTPTPSTLLPSYSTLVELSAPSNAQTTSSPRAQSISNARDSTRVSFLSSSASLPRL